MVSAQIVSVGGKAISPDDKMLILFNEKATHDLKEVSLIQKFNDDVNEINLNSSSKIKINSEVYDIKYLGKLVNDNLKQIGHVTLAFKAKPQNPLESTIYLGNVVFPKVKVGDFIEYIN